jgi:uncharacterized lipoprotein YajG
MKKTLFYFLSILALSFTSCKKDKEEAFGTHTMTSMIVVKQTGTTAVKNYSSKEADVAASIKEDGRMYFLIDGRVQGVWEQLDLKVKNLNADHKGIYTLQSKSNMNADVDVSYYRYVEAGTITNLYKSSETNLEGSIEITESTKKGKYHRISGSYRVVLKNVKNPDKNAATATDADNSDVTISGTFKDAWLVLPK